MNNIIRKLIGARSILIFLGFVAFLLLVSSQQVSAVEQQKSSYLIKVNRACNTITIYDMDSNGEYTVPIKAMLCSVGANGKTIKGTFYTKEKYRWKLLNGNVYGQYATRIVGGILFHSVYYYENGNPATLATDQYNKLGTSASHGCVRLSVGDAKWIYDHCSSGTTVIIYDNASKPGPLGKPAAIKIPTKVRWDPTDPSTMNPYKDTMPVITGTKNLVTDYGVELDLLSGVKAWSSLGNEITSQMSVKDSIDYKKAGVYQITYSVKDSMGRSVSTTIKMTVKQNSTPPEIIGVENKLVNGDVKIDNTFLLNGVEVYCADEKLDNNLIVITIDQTNPDDYNITYQITYGGKRASAKSIVHVDNEAPVFTGIKDLTLESGELPGKGVAMDGVTLTDNYTKQDDILLNLSYNDNQDGTYTIIYEATDEAGNIAKEQAILYYN